MTGGSSQDDRDRYRLRYVEVVEVGVREINNPQPKQRSIASTIDVLPESPGPTRRLNPGLKLQERCRMPLSEKGARRRRSSLFR